MQIKQALTHAIHTLKSAESSDSAAFLDSTSLLDSGGALDSRDAGAYSPDIYSLASHPTQAAPESTRTRFRLEAEILLGFVLGHDRVWLHTHDDHILNHDEQRQFFTLIDKRAQSYPIEYLTKRVSFLDMELFIDFGALIPRPESEILVERACSLLEPIISANTHTPRTRKNPHIIEVGVGSGALSIAIARALPQVQITATDISESALAIAQKNIEHFGLADRITLVQTSLFEGVDTAGVSLVLSNPPYIARTYPIGKSLHYEPACALFGGDRGNEILAEIIRACARESIPALACEMGYDQRISMQQLLESSGYEAEFYTDLAGFDRGFTAHKKL